MMHKCRRFLPYMAASLSVTLYYTTKFRVRIGVHSWRCQNERCEARSTIVAAAILERRRFMYMRTLGGIFTIQRRFRESVGVTA